MASTCPEASRSSPVLRKGSGTAPNTGDADADAATDGPLDSDPASDKQDAEDREGEGESDFEGDEDGDTTGHEADDWEELYACPLDVRFTQEKIHPFFYRRGPIVNVVPKIRAVLMREHSSADEILELVPPFNHIHCLRKGTELWSLDNRRLYALQLAAMEHWPRQCRVRLLCRDRLPRHKFKTQYRKFNTTSEGRTIDVCARYQQFDTWNWFNRAVELEWYYLSSRLGTLFSVFEILPVVGAVLYRTGVTGLGSRVPLVAGFALAFAVDFLRQRVLIFERRICELHVRAILDGDVKYIGGICRRSQHNDDGEEDPAPTSAVQLAAMLSLCLLLLLPYVLGVTRDKLRSSLLSCWTGLACVLAVQLASALRDAGGAAGPEQEKRLTPKHRE
uniref:Uncharacterized protein n=1 Tax=Alexandrium monilatum TaxID=311494 RepID=A0A7S4V3S0_9DINO